MILTHDSSHPTANRGIHPGPYARSVRTALSGRLWRTLIVSLVFLPGMLWTGGCEKTSSASVPRVHIGDHSWQVELAMTDKARYQGLSGRGPLKEDEGMLFVYPRARVRVFAMRGCEYPLDILFIGPDLRVVSRHRMEVESDLVGRTPYSSAVPAQYVLEVAGGTLDRTGIRVGDEVRLENVPNASTAEPGP